nr:MAG TPA: hypothetical protein [Caudoviricetes sp.]
MTRHPAGDRQPRHATHPATSATDIDKQDRNHIIEPTAKAFDEALKPSAPSKTTEPEQPENPKQDTGRETDTSAHPVIRPEADEPVRMTCDAHQTGVSSGKEQS